MAGDLLKHVGIGLGGADNSTHDMVCITQDAEAAGFSFVRIGDSGYDSTAMCGALAHATNRISVRTGVALWSRTPVQTTFAAATLDDLTRGRFSLGLGPGPKERSEGWHDINYDRVVGRFRDFVLAIRAAWEGRPGAPVDYSGEFYRFRKFALARQPFTNKLSIDLAANGPQMLRLAGELADQVLLNNVLGGRFPRETAMPAIRRGMERRSPNLAPIKVSGSVRVSVAGSREEALDRARPTLTYQFAIPYNRDLLNYYGLAVQRERLDAAIATGNPDTFVNAITDEMVDLFVVCGDGDTCRNVVASYGDVLDEISLAAPTVRDTSRGARTDYRPVIDVFAQ